MTISPEQLQKQADQFLNSLFENLRRNNIELRPHWDIDHICYRVETPEAYEQHKTIFAELGTLLIESQVNGRPIATFELNEPLRFQDWLIRLVELPAPKEGKKTRTGFEHAEFVVDIPLEEISKELSHLDWDDSGLSKIFNPELELKFENIALKFHHLSLKSVINFELRPKMAIVISELNLLEMFKENQPFIAGTIPLAIDVPGADVDFLVSFNNPDEFSVLCKQGFSLLPGFEISSGQMGGFPYCLCRFEYRSVPIEIFCSSQSTYQQNAFLHFQSEEKLLKYGPSHWTSEIVDLKTKGIKTEPTFARLLNASEVEAYALILELQKIPIKDLRRRIRSSLI